MEAVGTTRRAGTGAVAADPYAEKGAVRSKVKWPLRLRAGLRRKPLLEQRGAGRATRNASTKAGEGKGGKAGLRWRRTTTDDDERFDRWRWIDLPGRHHHGTNSPWPPPTCVSDNGRLRRRRMASCGVGGKSGRGWDGATAPAVGDGAIWRRESCCCESFGARRGVEAWLVALCVFLSRDPPSKDAATPAGCCIDRPIDGLD